MHLWYQVDPRHMLSGTFMSDKVVLKYYHFLGGVPPPPLEPTLDHNSETIDTYSWNIYCHCERSFPINGHFRKEITMNMVMTISCPSNELEITCCVPLFTGKFCNQSVTHNSWRQDVNCAWLFHHFALKICYDPYFTSRSIKSDRNIKHLPPLYIFLSLKYPYGKLIRNLK